MIKVESYDGRIAFSVQGEPIELYEECDILVHAMLGNEMLRIIFIKHLEAALPDLLKELNNDKNDTCNKSDK